MGSSLWVFAPYHYQPSRWMILKREGFSSVSESDSARVLTRSLDKKQLRDLYTLGARRSDEGSRFEFILHEQVSDLIQRGSLKVFRLNQALIPRLYSPADPLLMP